MTLNKRQSYFYLLLLTVIAFIFLSLFNNYHIAETQYTLVERPWEKYISIYNWDYISHYLHSILGFNKEYSWAVHVSYSVIIVSCIAMVILLYVMLWDVYTRKRKEKIYQELKNAYQEELKTLIFTRQELNQENILRQLKIAPDFPFTYTQKLLFINLLVELRMLTALTPSTLNNMQQIIRALGLYEFMENRLISGKDEDKLKIIQATRLLHIEISDSLMTRLINHRSAELRKAARLYYILSNEEDPFRYFEENTTPENVFLPWDKLEMHQLFEDCNAMHKKIPSFIPILNRIKDKMLTSFFIKETAYWGNSKDMDNLMTYLDSEEETYRKATVESISLRNIQYAETLLKERYYRQPEHIKRSILYALYQTSPTNSVSFFKEAYENTASLFTKRIALYCLWNTGESGQNEFLQLKKLVKSHEAILFQHVENEIINREALRIN